MNHIYKVIWNKAKNCYTVVSEIAKSHSDSTKRVRVGTTAALMAAAVLTGFAMPAQAAVSIGTDGTVKAEAADINALNNLLKNGVTTTTGGSVTVGGLTVKKNGEVSVNNSPDVVYGKNAKIIWDSNNTMGQISIGNNATAITGRGGQEEAFAYDGDYNHAAGAIAIGANTYARTGSIMIGSHVYKGNMGDVKNIDTDSFNTGSDGAYGFTVNSTTIGTNSFTRGNLATTIGDYNIQSGRSVGYGWRNAINYGAQNFGATVIGALNSNESQSDIVSSYFGTSTSGVANSIVGVANRVNSSNGTLVFGAGNEVTHSLSDIYGVGDTTSLKDAKKAQDALKNAVAESNAGGAVLAIGGANKADWARKSQLIGVGNTLTGASSAVSEYNMINGYKNEVTNATHTSIIGSNNKAKNIKSTIVMGDHNTLEDRENVISLGNNNTVKANNAVAIGNGTTVKAENGVAIGVGSVADRVADSEKGARGEFAPDTIPTGQESTWTSTKGAVSVGDTANNITRQITNVAAGREDTDAVNVAQLKKVNEEAGKHSVVTEGANITVTPEQAEDGRMQYNVALNNNIRLSGDNDAFVNISGSNGSVWASSSVAAGNVIMDGTTATVSGLGNTTTAYDGFANGEGKAATEEQLKEVSKVAENANQGWNLSTNGGEASKVAPGETVDISGDKNIKISNDGTNVKVKLNDNIDVNSVQTNALNAKYNLSVGTANENGTVPFFVNSNGAFYAANGKLVVDKDGKVTATEGEIGNVVLKNGVLYKNTALRDGELYVGDADGNYSQITSKNAKLGKVMIDDTGRISGVAAGRIAADSTDAINGSQLHAVQQEAGKHTKVVNGSNITVEETDQDGQKTYKVGLNKDLLLGDITGKNVSISGTNGTIETTGSIATKDKIYADKGAKLADVNVTGDTISNDKSSVKLDKEGTVTINNRVTIDQSGKISGVAAGEISSTSTDAVNGSQLKATNDRVSQVEGNITEIKGDITNIKSDITNIKGDVKNLGDRVTKVEQEAGKHTKVVNGSNVTVEETDQDGQKTYKVGLNKDLLLGDITGKNVSISGTNGTIETTGSIATKDKIYADKGAKLADIDITGDTISNGQSSVKLDKEGTVTINGKVSVNQDGKVSGVAAGDLSEKSTDAVNGSQLFATNQQVAQNVQSISKLGNRINKVGAGAAALAALHPLDFDPDDKWDIAAGYGNYNGENAAAIGAYYRPNEDTMFSVGGSFGNGENMVNAGVSLKLGQGNHVSTSKVAMAKEIKDLRKELEGLKSALLDVNAGKKLDTSKLQLFPDVPKNHWAYEYVSTLKGNGVLTGYPDGEFKGDRPMTRYEFATMLYKAMLEGATLSDKILKEFAPELERFTVDTVHQDKDGKPTVERVRTVKAEK